MFAIAVFVALQHPAEPFQLPPTVDGTVEEIVPPEILARPDRDELRRLDRADAALVVDGYLRRLTSQEARARRIFGTLASAFLRRRAHHVLGFVRVDDYTRERLGLSSREL